MYIKYNNLGKLKIKSMEKIYYANINQKKVGMAILM